MLMEVRIGVVIRNSNRSVLLAEAFYFGITTSFNAESMALLRGLQLCALHGLFSVDIETDSKSLGDYIRTGRFDTCP